MAINKSQFQLECFITQNGRTSWLPISKTRLLQDEGIRRVIFECFLEALQGEEYGDQEKKQSEAELG